MFQAIRNFFGAGSAVPKSAPRPVTKPAPTVKTPLIRAEPAPAPKVYPDTQNGRARKLFDDQMFFTLDSYRRGLKKGWRGLGFTAAEERRIKLMLGE